MPRPIQELLDALGSTPDEMAASLEAMGIVVRRDNCKNCPLAVFLKKQGYTEVEVADRMIEASKERNSRCFVMPDAKTQKLIERIDDGTYPEIILY
jgi:hypothetical protein